MAQFDNITVTRAGRAYMATSLAESKALAFDHISIGDGYAPPAPEDLTELVHPIASVPIAKITDDGGGIVSVRGNFVAVGETGGFSFREAGVYVRAWTDGDPPVLFAYCNAGDNPDYIPPVGETSIMEEALIFSIVVGGAKVLFNGIDPTARATMQDVTDLESELKTMIAALAEELESTKKELNDAKEALEQSIADLETASGDYVKWTDLATKDKAGIVKIGDNLNVDASGKVSVPVATKSVPGVMKPGANMSVSAGVLTFSLDGYTGNVSLTSTGGSKLVLNSNAELSTPGTPIIQKNGYGTLKITDTEARLFHTVLSQAFAGGSESSPSAALHVYNVGLVSAKGSNFQVVTESEIWLWSYNGNIKFTCPSIANGQDKAIRHNTTNQIYSA